MSRVWREMGIARGIRALLRLNQPGGIDCLSCAWPDPDEGRGIGRVLRERRQGRRLGGRHRPRRPRVLRPALRRRTLASSPTTGSGSKGGSRSRWSCAPARTHYEPIAWDDAFGLIAAELNALASPDEAIFYTSGRTSNEAAFLYQLFVRQFGTNNLPDCSNMCHESSGSALSADDRHRQGHGQARRLREGRGDLHHRPESRHESSADAARARRRAKRSGRQDRRRQSAARSRA